MTPIDFTDNQNIMRRVIWGYIYTLMIHIPIYEKTWNFPIFTVTLETFARFDG